MVPLTDTTKISQKQLSHCPIKIPKSGQKIFTYKGVTLFFRSVAGVLTVYEAKHKFLIAATTRTKEETMKILISDWERITDEIDRRESA